MKVIISPAKQMKICEDDLLPLSTPRCLDKAACRLHQLQSKSYEELKEILQCSDKLATEAYQNYQTFRFDQNPSAAILTYKGIQYQYMAPQILEDASLSYLQNHLFILSGLYGILRPFDGIVKYRLEMQAKVPNSLYDYWTDDLANTINDNVILNLASEEYAKCIRPYKALIDVHFYEQLPNKRVEKGVYVKMARGQMVRFLAEHQIESLDDVKKFRESGYEFDEETSTETVFNFVRKSNNHELNIKTKHSK